jgi:hypothetical protein
MSHHQARSSWQRRMAAVAAVAALALGLLVTLAPAASAKANHPKRPGLHLTAAQKTCLTQHGVQVPTATNRSTLSVQQRQALRAAMQACGVQRLGRPGGFGGPGLTSVQRTCLAQHGVQLGGGGGPGVAGGRQAFAAAAQACGIHRGGGAPPTT